jgi:isopenicillin N synthase-like dioxygenase
MTMESSSIMSVPPWPIDVPTASLNTLSLAKLLQNDEAELAALFSSCKTSGFFLLDLRGCKNGEDLLADTEKLFHLAKELNGMPIEEKKQYALAPGTAFG